MRFLPTDDQVELQRGVRELLASKLPLEKLATGYDATVWDALAEVGVFSLRGELELGWAETVLVVEELGRACAFQHIGILSLEFHVDKLSRPLL